MYRVEKIKEKQSYKTGEVAKILGISIITAIRYCDKGIIKSKKNQYGHRRIGAEELCEYLKETGMLIEEEDKRKDVIYARVSTHKQASRGDLQRQIDKLKIFAIDYNVKDLEIKKDIGSGLNDNRRELKILLKMVQENKVKRIFISYKDRLTRFGYNYIKQICDFHNVEIIILSENKNKKSESEELAEDIIALIHLFSGKIYGLRNRVKKGIVQDERKEKKKKKGSK